MTRQAIRRFLRQTDGAAAVEFVLIAPVILLMFVGMINFGFRYYEEARLNQATRETAEASMFTQDLTVLRQTLANSIAELGPSISGVPYTGSVAMFCTCPGQADIPNCTASQAASCAATGMAWGIIIEIRAQMSYRPLIPLVGQPANLQSVLRVQVR